MHAIGYRQIGQLFMVGFEGTNVTPQIRSLIEEYHIGCVMLAAKNLKCIFTLCLYCFCLPLVRHCISCNSNDTARNPFLPHLSFFRRSDSCYDTY